MLNSIFIVVSNSMYLQNWLSVCPWSVSRELATVKKSVKTNDARFHNLHLTISKQMERSNRQQCNDAILTTPNNAMPSTVLEEPFPRGWWCIIYHQYPRPHRCKDVLGDITRHRKRCEVHDSWWHPTPASLNLRPGHSTTVTSRNNIKSTITPPTLVQDYISTLPSITMDFPHHDVHKIFSIRANQPPRVWLASRHLFLCSRHIQA